MATTTASLRQLVLRALEYLTVAKVCVLHAIILISRYLHAVAAWMKRALTTPSIHDPRVEQPLPLACWAPSVLSQLKLHVALL